MKNFERMQSLTEGLLHQIVNYGESQRDPNAEIKLDFAALMLEAVFTKTQCLEYLKAKLTLEVLEHMELYTIEDFCTPDEAIEDFHETLTNVIE